jgi:hypothetical protein
MLKITVQPFAEAARPLEILSHILSKWVHSKHVSAEQLDAWVLARRSFLNNECTLMIQENDKIVVFMLVVMCMMLLMQVFLVFTHHNVAASLVIGISLTGFGALTCIQSAISCYHQQAGHKELLRNLKEAVICTAPARCHQIDAIMTNLEKQDYQTKLEFLPLNPVLLKSIIAYIATGCVAMGGKLMTVAHPA